MSPLVPHAKTYPSWQPRGAPGANSGLALGRPSVALSRRHNVGAAVAGITGVAATDILTKVGHGLAEGDNVVGSGLTAGTNLAKYLLGGLFIKFLSANTFSLSTTPGGPALDLGTDVTTLTLQKISSSAPVR